MLKISLKYNTYDYLTSVYLAWNIPFVLFDFLIIWLLAKHFLFFTLILLCSLSSKLLLFYDIKSLGDIHCFIKVSTTVFHLLASEITKSQALPASCTGQSYTNKLCNIWSSIQYFFSIFSYSTVHFVVIHNVWSNVCFHFLMNFCTLNNELITYTYVKKYVKVEPETYKSQLPGGRGWKLKICQLNLLFYQLFF